MKSFNQISIKGGNRYIEKLLIMVCIMLAGSLPGQNNLLYVSPNITGHDSFKIDKEIKKNIKSKIPGVKGDIGYISYTENPGDCYSKIVASSIKYLLKLEMITRSGELQFALSEVDMTGLPSGEFRENDITWENATYLVGKMNFSTQIESILVDINDQLEYYFENKEFRPRIFINPEKFEPADKLFTVNLIDWLEEKINISERSDKFNYILYFDDRPYPKDASCVLYGKFISPDDGRTEVEFIILKNQKSSKTRPIEIYVDDFEHNEFNNEDKYKKKVIDEIYKMLSRSDFVKLN